jgi:acyl-CoA thioesterase FadM
VAVDYFAPVAFAPGLTLRVETTVGHIGTSSWTMNQLMYAAEQLISRCECVLVAYSYPDARSRPLDDDERKFWSAYLR